MQILLNSFGGIAPKVNDPLLPDNMATIAQNLRVDRGSIRSLKGVLASATVPNTAQSIFKYAGSWLYSTYANVDWSLSQVPNDAWGRLYYTGTDQPRYTFTGRPSSNLPNGLWLGIPKPGNAPSATKSGTPSGTPFTRYYLYCYVSPLGEEGPPSAPSSGVSMTSAETANITFTTESLGSYNLGGGSAIAATSMASGRTYIIQTVGTTNWTALGAAAATVGTIFTYNGAAITGSGGMVTDGSGYRRLYRTTQGTTTTSYEFVADIPIATLTYADTLLDNQLGEILPSTHWYPPPTSMVGIKAHPNGFMVGYAGNTLYPSERYLPHAYNPNNELAFPSAITGLAITGDSIIVFTTEYPYLVTGTDPASLTAVKIDHTQTCQNKASIVNMGGYALFASPDGLVSVTANDMQVATMNLLTLEQWQAYSPSTLKGFVYEGIYVGISSAGAFMLDTRQPPAVLTSVTGMPYIAGYNDLTTDTLYLLDASGNIVAWEGGSQLTFTWQSKPERVSKPTCPSAVRIFGSGTVTLQLIADGVTVGTLSGIALSSGIAYISRLWSGYKAKEFKINISGTGSVDSIAIANSIEELQ